MTKNQRVTLTPQILRGDVTNKMWESILKTFPRHDVSSPIHLSTGHPWIAHFFRQYFMSTYMGTKICLSQRIFDALFICFIYYFQGDPGPMVPKGNIYKQVTEKISWMHLTQLFGLADLKSPKVKKWPKKDDHDNTDKKQVSMFPLFF